MRAVESLQSLISRACRHHQREKSYVACSSRLLPAQVGCLLRLCLEYAGEVLLSQIGEWLAHAVDFCELLVLLWTSTAAAATAATVPFGLPSWAEMPSLRSKAGSV